MHQLLRGNWLAFIKTQERLLIFEKPVTYQIEDVEAFAQPRSEFGEWKGAARSERLNLDSSHRLPGQREFLLDIYGCEIVAGGAGRIGDRHQRAQLGFRAQADWTPVLTAAQKSGDNRLFAREERRVR